MRHARHRIRVSTHRPPSIQQATSAFPAQPFAVNRRLPTPPTQHPPSVGNPLPGLLGTKTAFNPHSRRPPQTPAASFKSPYRKRLGPVHRSSPGPSYAKTFPIKASDYTLKCFMNAMALERVMRVLTRHWSRWRGREQSNLRYAVGAGCSDRPEIAPLKRRTYFSCAEPTRTGPTGPRRRTIGS